MKVELRKGEPLLKTGRLADMPIQRLLMLTSKTCANVYVKLSNDEMLVVATDGILEFRCCRNYPHDTFKVLSEGTVLEITQ